MQYPMDTDGMHITARWAKVCCFCCLQLSSWVADCNNSNFSFLSLAVDYGSCRCGPMPVLILVVWLWQEMLFIPESYKCSSRHNDLVAFSFDVSLMLRVLRSAHTNSADVLELKLCMRQLPAAASTQPVSKPFLAFSSKGHNINMVQDMPVSKPLTAAGKNILIIVLRPFL